ncbi:hypothetical protein AWJ20_2525 [Sugiyamaella lignohabitans]|uniref:C2H2-type domain-containing protein n=1 Tax=Sugiyamaella lignohabitans TaxID=796027 RepID=A0A161HGK8_9ASCO|nr:uncharacterized protein AWJ20_2525 [Sugiyamaella lignohabitans]ANB14910.1 hypothetical protein AWJ20_2525 [Sugiyamaella lignohabitans]
MSDFTMSNPPEHQFPSHHPTSMVSPTLPSANAYNPRQPPRSPVENFYHTSNNPSSMQYPVQDDLFGTRLSISGGSGIPPPPLPSGLGHYSTTNTGGYQMQSSSSSSSSNHGSFSGPSYMTSSGGTGSNQMNSNSNINSAAAAAARSRRRRSSADQSQLQQQHHHHHRTTSNGTVYEFVSLPASQNNKRPRRKYEEIERIYNCSYPSCTKAYGTLNHLNAHVTMQRHGNKRTPDEFRETRRLWKLRKKERQIMNPGKTSSGPQLPQQHQHQQPQQQQQQPQQLPHQTHGSYSTGPPVSGAATLSRPPPSGTLLPPLGPPSPISMHSTSPTSSYFSRPPNAGAGVGPLPPTPLNMSMSSSIYGSDLNHIKYMNQMNSGAPHMPYTHQPPSNYESSQYYREEMS